MNVPKVNGSYSAYVRLAVSKNLDNIDKFIYIDCDTLILQNLEELWDTDIDGYAVGGVSDAMSARCNLALGKGCMQAEFTRGDPSYLALFFKLRSCYNHSLSTLC